MIKIEKVNLIIPLKKIKKIYYTTCIDLTRFNATNQNCGVTLIKKKFKSQDISPQIELLIIETLNIVYK